MLPTVLMVLMVLARAQTPTPAVCTDHHSAQPNSKAAFIEANIIGLAYARDAVRGAEEFDKQEKSMDWKDSLVAMMRLTKVASDVYVCAGRVLQPYEHSQDKNTGRLAAVAVQTYRQHQALNEKYLALFRLLDSTSDQLSTIEVERNKLWTVLTDVVRMSALSLMDQARTDNHGKLNAILITKAERDSLRYRLAGHFPGIRIDSKNDSAPVRLARIYYQFLNRPLKCADER